MAWRMPLTLWLDRLSITTMSPCRRVGTRSCSTHARNVSPLTGPSMTQGALAQSSDESGCFPVSVRDRAHQPFAARATAVKPSHLRGRAALVDEDHALRFHVPLTGAPFHVRLGDVGPILLRSSQRLFLSGKPRWRRRFHKQPTLTFTPCVASSHARISSIWFLRDPLAQRIIVRGQLRRRPASRWTGRRLTGRPPTPQRLVD